MPVRAEAESTQSSGHFCFHRKTFIALFFRHSPVWEILSDRQAEVDKSFTDIADTLDFTAALNLEVRKSHWFFFANGLYLKTSQDAKPTRSIAGLVENVDLRLKQYLINSGLGYQVVDTKKFSLELFAGARIYVLDPEITLSLPAATPSRSGTKAWADPIVGLFTEYRLAKPVALFTEADVGGFGLNSDITWQVNGGVQWDFARHWYLRGSYRFLSTDFDKAHFKFDVDQGGPQLEIGYHF